MPESKLNVRLLQYTPSPTETVALAGRLCYSDSDIASLGDKSRGSSDKFASKLLDLGHLSPIEHASFTFGVEGVSRALLAQITRHRIASFSVQSQRYVRADEFNFIVPPTVRALGEAAIAEYENQMRTIHSWYKNWLESGLAAEDARFVLPNAAETRIVFTMNARELIHFFSLRCCNRAQWEIRHLAWAMLGMVLRVAPSLFRDAGASCVHSSCSEGKMSCGQKNEMCALAITIRDMAARGASDSEFTEFAISQ